MSGGIGKVQKIDLGTARSSELKDISGREIQVVDASSASARVSIALQDNITDLKFFEMRKNGRIGDRQGFSKFYIQNEAQSGEWVKIIVTDGNDDFYVENSDLGVINEIAAPVKTGGDALSADTVTVDNTSTEIIAANSSRRGWTIQNPSTTLPLLIGPSGSEVYPIPPEGEKSGTGTYAIYGIYASGSEDVAFMEDSVT